MIPTASIVVVDDNLDDLEAIVSSLQGLGAACLPIHVENAEPKLAMPLKNVQIIFFDIVYLQTVTTPPQVYDVAANVLGKVIRDDNGPYVLITWSTRHTDHGEFMERLCNTYPNIPPPAASAALKKEDFTGAGKTSPSRPAQLRTQIKKILTDCPQVNTLFIWQQAALEAAGSVAGTVLDMVKREDRFMGNPGPSLECILNAVVREAVGPGNVAKDRLRALNEGLGPILLDRLTHASVSDQKTKTTLRNAIPKPEVPPHLPSGVKPLLNNMHSCSFKLLNGTEPGERGAVCTLPDAFSGKNFVKLAGMNQSAALIRFLVPKEKNNPPKWEKLKKVSEWMLVGLTAPCDEAQKNATHLRRVALALEVPNPLPDCLKLPQMSSPAIACTPIYLFDGQERQLFFNWLFVTAVPNAMWEGSNVKFRIRDPLISDLGIKFTSHAARLGHTSFDRT